MKSMFFTLIVLFSTSSFAGIQEECQTPEMQELVRTVHNGQDVPEHMVEFANFVYDTCRQKTESEHIQDEVRKLMNIPATRRSIEWSLNINGQELEKVDFNICKAVFGETSMECRQAQAHIKQKVKVGSRTEYQCNAQMCIITSNY